MTKHEIIIYWSQADQAFVAEVPELPGCATDGKTHKEALANVEIVIGEWIIYTPHWWILHTKTWASTIECN